MLRTSSVSSFFRAWGPLLGKYVGVQLIIQFLGMVSGLFLVRCLSKHEYAMFTIANTMIGTMNLLADSGVESGLMTIGGRVWRDPVRFAQLIRTGLDLRNTFGAGAVVAVMPIIVFLLHKNGAAIPEILSIAIVVAVSFRYQLYIGVLVVVPKLLLQTSRLQQLEIAGVVLRLLLLALAWFTLLNAPVAIAVATAVLALQAWLLTRWIKSTIITGVLADVGMREEMMAIVRRQVPNSLYYCFQGQLTVWLISIFGSSSEVADVGALGRLSVIFAVIASVMTTIVIPRFARCHERSQLARRYVQIVALQVILIVLLVGAALAFPDQLLWVLGGGYSQLHRELVLIVFSTGITAFVGSLWSLNVSRGWYLPPWLNIGASIVAQIAAISLVDLHTVQGAILVGCAPCIPVTILYIVCAFRGIGKVAILENA